MEPVRVDVIAYAPTAFFHCQHCEISFQQLGIGARMRQIEAADSLPPDLQLVYLDLSDWIHDLRNRHGDRVVVRVIDAASLPGVWTSLRHGSARTRQPGSKGAGGGSDRTTAPSTRSSTGCSPTAPRPHPDRRTAW